MTPVNRIAPISLCLSLLISTAALAENEGIEDLDKASDVKLTAASVRDLSEVIDLAQAAIDKGLDEENTQFANQLLTATLFERAQIVSRMIFEGAGPDPRWPQFRQAALGDLERSIRLDPNQPRAQLIIARLHALPGGNKERALRAVNQVIDAAETPKDVRSKAITMRGGLQEDDEKRLADYNQAIELDDQNLDAVRARGLYYLLKQEPAKAVADLTRAIEIEPGHGPTYEARGMALLLDEKTDDAIADFEQAIELLPDSATPLVHRARAYGIGGAWDKALADLNEAIKLEPKALPVLLMRAQIHFQAGDAKAAVDDLDAAIRLNPDHMQAQRMRAELLAGSGKMDDAIEGLERLHSAKPTDPDVLLQLGMYYMADKQPRQAIKQFDLVLEGDPSNWMAYRNRGDARLSIAQHAEAIADYEAALKLKPDDSGILNNLAWVLATSPNDDLRNGARSVELATKACEVTDYEAPHILSTLAAAHAEAGDFDKAVEWSTKAVELGDEEETKEQLAAELESYKQKKPWREEQNVEQETAENPEETSGPSVEDLIPDDAPVGEEPDVRDVIERPTIR